MTSRVNSYCLWEVVHVDFWRVFWALKGALYLAYSEAAQKIRFTGCPKLLLKISKKNKKRNFDHKIWLHLRFTLYYLPTQAEILKIDESQDIVVLKSKVWPLIHPLWLLCCSPILMEAKSVWMIWSKIMIQNLKNLIYKTCINIFT